MNITVDKTEAVKSSAMKLCRTALTFMGRQVDIEERVMGLLSHVMPLSSQTTDIFLSDNTRSVFAVMSVSRSLRMVNHLYTCWGQGV